VYLFASVEKDLRKLAVLLLAVLPFAAPASAQKAATLLERITTITALPELKHSTVGVEIYDLTDHKVLAAINQDKLFTPGSTTKVVTEGVALALLGADYRFHTRVYHTGKITPDGTLEGDLVLVASGDPDLSGRVMLDDTLDYTSSDHSYAGVSAAKPVRGEPLRAFKELASGVLMKGIWRIRGHVVVDASLFSSTQVEPATHTTISPIVLNDNVVDIMAVAGHAPGDPAFIEVSPDLPYLKVINKVRTGKEDSDPQLQFSSDSTEAGGYHTVVLEGTVPAHEKALAVYKVSDPVLYATTGFREALRWANIVLEEPVVRDVPELPPHDSPRQFLVEHVSPPFKEEVRLTLKVSQNLHAALTPYLLGSILGHGSADALQKGFALERRFLAKANLSPELVSQLDGEGGVGTAFSPDFMVRYLDYMSRQPYGRLLFDSLPVLGRDGTLTEMMKNSPAAGHVHAKTGSYVVANTLNDGVMLLGKGLVGYVDAVNGHRLIFAAYVNMVPLLNMDEVGGVGEMLGRIAAAAYEYAPAQPAAQHKPPVRKPGSKAAKTRG
jgi:D-alanyl-D-alanine carboxypeptidase/D-alanyl-D-alanine-endopeptidase (penicillin-binding protein 4)